MSTVSVSSVRSASPPLGWLRSPPAVLLAKDLRLGALVFVPCLAFLCVLVLFSAAMPIFGFDFARSSGLMLMWSQDLAGRIGYFAGIYWTVAFFAPLLSATAIVSGDGSSPARHLLPAMPVRPIVVYASKAGAVAITVTVFVGIALAVDSISGWRPEVEPGPFAAALSLGLIWAFAAPLFRRGFVGVFVVTFVIPSVLFGLCGVSARLIAGSAVRETLVAMDLARWYADPAIPFERWALSKRPLNDAAIACAYAVVAALGLWCAWSARGVMLGRRSPGGLPPIRIMRFAGVALLATLVTTGATAVRTWQSDEKIATALATARVYEDMSARSTAELVETFVRSRARIAPPAPLPNGQITPVWDSVLRADAPFSRSSPAERGFRRALSAVLRDRRESDPAQLKDAMRSVLAGTEGRTIGMQLAAAQWFGGYTHTMVALQGLARTTDDNERAALILVLCLNSHLFGPEQPGPTSEALASPDRPRPWGFVGWDLPPYRIRDFDIEQQYRFVEARVSVVLLLTSLERQLQDGTLKLQNAYKKDDWLEIDAATLRAAREAAERPLADLARDTGVTAQRSRDPSRYSDDQTLYLRTSELFDPAKTDPSYLLPEK
jgi:hypothetical protein